MVSESQRLLIVSCTRSKRPDPDLMPAIVRYDGPTFRVLRRFLRIDSSSGVDTLILSAEHGLIAASEQIANYDRRMTTQRATELRPQVSAQIRAFTAERPYQDIFVCLGKDYHTALDFSAMRALPAGRIAVAEGSMGKRLAHLHDWLHQNAPQQPHQSPEAIHSLRTAVIRGIELTLSTDQVVQTARERISTDVRAATRYQSWYVQIDDQRIAPKWLVSHLTGLPVGAFVTDDARRVLGQLGIEVRRV